MDLCLASLLSASVPRRVLVHLRRADRLLSLSQPGAALPHFHQALAQATPAVSGLAAALLEPEREQSAMAARDWLLGLAPAGFDAVAVAARAMLQSGNRQGAEALAALLLGCRIENRGPLLKLTMLLRELEQFASAMATARKILALMPQDLFAILELGRSASACGDHESALAAFTLAATLAPRQVWRWLDLAATQTALGRTAEAEASYRQVVEIEPANLPALLELGRLARARNDHETALAAFAPLAAAVPGDAWRWIDVGEELSALGRLEAAEDAYRRACAAAPENTRAALRLAACIEARRTEPGALLAHIERGRTARARADHAAALDAFATVAAALPDDVWRWLDVAQEQHALGLAAEEETSYARILALEPENTQGLLGLARNARQRGDHDAALRLFTTAADLVPHDMWRWLDVGEELAVLGRQADAEEAFRRACAAEPENPSAVLRLAQCIRAQTGEDAALVFFQAYAAGHPEALWARLHVAASLRTLNRLDEAETVCRAVQTQAPANAEAAMGLGLCARARRQHAGALHWFQQAVQHAPDQLWPRLELVQTLRATGAGAEALQAAQDLLVRHPAALPAMLSAAQCLSDASQHEAALALYERAAAAFPDESGVLVELAAEERKLGRHDAAEARLAIVLERDPFNVAAISDLGRTALLLGNFAEAYQLFNEAAAGRPDELIFQMGLVDTLAAAGEVDDAVLKLEMLETERGPLEGLRVKRISQLRQTGRYHEALVLARESTTLHPGNFWLWFERFFCELQTGSGSMVQACLNRMPAHGAQEYSIRQRCRGLYAESRLMFGTALHYYRQAATLTPQEASPQNDIVRVTFMTLDVKTSLSHLRQACALTAHNTKLLGRPLNISQTHYGQVLDEYRMDLALTGELAGLWQQPPARRLPKLHALTLQSPSSTALATTLLLSMRQCAPLHGTPQPGIEIPRIIHQFWDTDAPPPDILAIMQSWPKLNPGWQVNRFNDRTAQAFLAQSFSPAVLAAYRRVREPAQRADLFRLAALAALGGVYADADDRCLHAMDHLLPPGQALVLYQEDLGTLGNNFMAATPRHPLLLRTLTLAVAAIARGDSDIVWLATGPGLISRTVAEWIATTGGMPAGVFVFDRREIFQAIGMHCAAGYKRTNRHWLEASFPKRERRKSAT